MDVVSDVMTALRVEDPTGARVRWRAPWSVRFDSRPGTAGFLIVLQGSAWMWTEDGGPVALGPGDVVFSPDGAGYTFADSPDSPIGAAPPGPDPLAFGAGDDVTAVTLCGGYRLDPDRTHPLLRELPATMRVPADAGRHPHLGTAVDILREEDGGARPGAHAILPLALDMLLLYLMRAWFEDRSADADTATGWAAALMDRKIGACLNALHGDPARPWTVQDLADIARLSRAAFSRRFSALVGQPPLTYLTWWRMTVAAGLLRDTDGPLAVIADQVGYLSEFAFATAFKRHHGTSPGRFRRSHRGGALPRTPPTGLAGLPATRAGVPPAAPR